jgi:hypothetical protein
MCKPIQKIITQLKKNASDAIKTKTQKQKPELMLF